MYMLENFYTEIEPKKREKLLLDTPGEERVKELFYIRFSNDKTGKKNLGVDRYLRFLMNLNQVVRQKPFFIKKEIKKIRQELSALMGTAGADEAFSLEMKNAAMRFFSMTGKYGDSRRLIVVGTVEENIKIADQGMSAWRIVYGAPRLLQLNTELAPVSEAVKSAFGLLDESAAERLEDFHRKLPS